MILSAHWLDPTSSDLLDPLDDISNGMSYQDLYSSDIPYGIS